MNHNEAAERAKTLAAQHHLGVRQQKVLRAMLESGRWPLALPETGIGVWIWDSWSATAKTMASLARKGVIVATGNTSEHGGQTYPEYVVAEKERLTPNE